MIPTQSQSQQPHLVSYSPATSGHMATPTPTSNMMPYYQQPQQQLQQQQQQSQAQAQQQQQLQQTGNKKPKNLRVEIPNDNDDGEPQQKQPQHQQPYHPYLPLAPPSALPSQFAHNLPSPSTFYPEFYQQSELPSPLNFSSTPTGTSFYWPSRNPSMSGPAAGGDYKPSPLAKM